MKAATIHGASLARQLAAQIQHAACAGRGTWWTRQETAHAEAATTAQAARVGGRILRVCEACPNDTRRTCAELAEVGRYTGFAGGQRYVDGRPYAATSLSNHPQSTQTG